jgi:predicted nucleic acid-binding protein
VTLVDTSAWIEYLRATGSQTHESVRSLLERDEPLHTTDMVVMEVLAGARNDDHRDRLRRLLSRCEYVPIEGLVDYEAAADIFRICRGAGATVRSLTDCLIAVVAIRQSLPVLHADRDFDALARHTELQIQVSGPGAR